jgi:hypothetical protein
MTRGGPRDRPAARVVVAGQPAPAAEGRPVSNPSKDKGTWAEGQVVKGCHARDIPAKREVLHGNKDHGDVHIYGGRVVVEVKWRPNLPSPNQVAKWMQEADAEGLNAGADLSALVYNRPGYGAANIGHWLVVMWRDEYLWLSTRGAYTGVVSGGHTVTIDFDQFCDLLHHMPGAVAA